MIYNPYPQVDLPFGDDNLYFRILFDAICKVEKHYIEYKLKCDNVSDDEMKKNHVERVFAYELYRQWENRIASEGIALTLNAEITKLIESEPINVEEYGLDNNERKHPHFLTTYPDLVLHHSQSKKDNQEIICEIKRGLEIPGSMILGDLYKISRYMSKLGFRYGVFILTNGMLSDIKMKITTPTTILRKNKKDIKHEGIMKVINNKSSNIVCITYDGTTLKYKTLEKLLNEEIQNDD